MQGLVCVAERTAEPGRVLFQIPDGIVPSSIPEATFCQMFLPSQSELRNRRLEVVLNRSRWQNASDGGKGAGEDLKHLRFVSYPRDQLLPEEEDDFLNAEVRRKILGDVGGGGGLGNGLVGGSGRVQADVVSGVLTGASGGLSGSNPRLNATGGSGLSNSGEQFITSPNTTMDLTPTGANSRNQFSNDMYNMGGVGGGGLNNVNYSNNNRGGGGSMGGLDTGMGGSNSNSGTFNSGTFNTGTLTGGGLIGGGMGMGMGNIGMGTGMGGGNNDPRTRNRIHTMDIGSMPKKSGAVLPPGVFIPGINVPARLMSDRSSVGPGGAFGGAGFGGPGGTGGAFGPGGFGGLGGLGGLDTTPRGMGGSNLGMFGGTFGGTGGGQYQFGGGQFGGGQFGGGQFGGASSGGNSGDTPRAGSNFTCMNIVLLYKSSWSLNIPIDTEALWQISQAISRLFYTHNDIFLPTRIISKDYSSNITGNDNGNGSRELKYAKDFCQRVFDALRDFPRANLSITVSGNPERPIGLDLAEYLGQVAPDEYIIDASATNTGGLPSRQHTAGGMGGMGAFGPGFLGANKIERTGSSSNNLHSHGQIVVSTSRSPSSTDIFGSVSHGHGRHKGSTTHAHAHALKDIMKEDRHDKDDKYDKHEIDFNTLTNSNTLKNVASSATLHTDEGGNSYASNAMMRNSFDANILKEFYINNDQYDHLVSPAMRQTFSKLFLVDLVMVLASVSSCNASVWKECMMRSIYMCGWRNCHRECIKNVVQVARKMEKRVGEMGGGRGGSGTTSGSGVNATMINAVVTSSSRDKVGTETRTRGSTDTTSVQPSQSSSVGMAGRKDNTNNVTKTQPTNIIRKTMRELRVGPTGRKWKKWSSYVVQDSHSEFTVVHRSLWADSAYNTAAGASKSSKSSSSGGGVPQGSQQSGEDDRDDRTPEVSQNVSGGEKVVARGNSDNRNFPKKAMSAEMFPSSPSAGGQEHAKNTTGNNMSKNMSNRNTIEGGVGSFMSGIGNSSVVAQNVTRSATSSHLTPTSSQTLTRADSQPGAGDPRVRPSLRVRPNIPPLRIGSKDSPSSRGGSKEQTTPKKTSVSSEFQPGFEPATPPDPTSSSPSSSTKKYSSIMNVDDDDGKNISQSLPTQTIATIQAALGQGEGGGDDALLETNSHSLPKMGTSHSLLRTSQSQEDFEIQRSHSLESPGGRASLQTSLKMNNDGTQQRNSTSGRSDGNIDNKDKIKHNEDNGTQSGLAVVGGAYSSSSSLAELGKSSVSTPGSSPAGSSPAGASPAASSPAASSPGSDKKNPLTTPTSAVTAVTAMEKSIEKSPPIDLNTNPIDLREKLEEKSLNKRVTDRLVALNKASWVGIDAVQIAERGSIILRYLFERRVLKRYRRAAFYTPLIARRGWRDGANANALVVKADEGVEVRTRAGAVGTAMGVEEKGTGIVGASSTSKIDGEEERNNKGSLSKSSSAKRSSKKEELPRFPSSSSSRATDQFETADRKISQRSSVQSEAPPEPHYPGSRRSLQELCWGEDPSSSNNRSRQGSRQNLQSGLQTVKEGSSSPPGVSSPNSPDDVDQLIVSGGSRRGEDGVVDGVDGVDGGLDMFPHKPLERDNSAKSGSGDSLNDRRSVGSGSRSPRSNRSDSLNSLDSLDPRRILREVSEDERKKSEREKERKSRQERKEASASSSSKSSKGDSVGSDYGKSDSDDSLDPARILGKSVESERYGSYDRSGNGSYDRSGNGSYDKYVPFSNKEPRSTFGDGGDTSKATSNATSKRGSPNSKRDSKEDFGFLEDEFSPDNGMMRRDDGDDDSRDNFERYKVVGSSSRDVRSSRRPPRGSGTPKSKSGMDRVDRDTNAKSKSPISKPQVAKKRKPARTSMNTEMNQGQHDFTPPTRSPTGAVAVGRMGMGGFGSSDLHTEYRNNVDERRILLKKTGLSFAEIDYLKKKAASSGLHGQSGQRQHGQHGHGAIASGSVSRSGAAGSSSGLASRPRGRGGGVRRVEPWGRAIKRMRYNPFAFNRADAELLGELCVSGVKVEEE